MEGGGGFPFGGDPEDLLRGLREFAEQQAESVQEAQREQFATLIHYLLEGLNEDRWPFALLLLVLAASIFALGMAEQRYGRALAARFVRRPPPSLPSS